jgi:hypothetical protein
MMKVPPTLLTSAEGTAPKKLVRFLAGVLLSCLLAACRFNGSAPPVERSVLPPLPTPVQLVCTESVDGPTLTATPLSPGKAHIELKGLEPGERLLLVFLPDEADGGSRMEARPETPVAADGTYESIENLYPSPENLTRQWEIQVVHSHGVTCGAITMPEE